MSDIVRDAIAALVALQTQLSSVPSAPFGYGVDLACVDDIDLNMRETDPNSVESLAQDSFHRVTTARGSLPDDPNFGVDLRSLLSKPITPASERSIITQVQGELQKDDRISIAQCTLRNTGTFAKPSYLVTIAITPADPAVGPFNLVLAVTDGQALLADILK